MTWTSQQHYDAKPWRRLTPASGCPAEWIALSTDLPASSCVKLDRMYAHDAAGGSLGVPLAMNRMRRRVL